MIHITSLKTFPTMDAAYNACTTLYASFKAANKRAEKVDLFVGSHGDVKSGLIHEIRVHFTSEYKADAQWFVNAAKSL